MEKETSNDLPRRAKRQQPELQPCVKFLCRRRFILPVQDDAVGYTLTKSLLYTYAALLCASGTESLYHYQVKGL